MIVPVMSLVYLEHGASIENLALYIAIYFVAVIVLEVPSGMSADLLGRKRVFLWAHIFLTVYYITTLLSHSAVPLVLANVFHGAGRAFSSGSLEALLIDKAIKKQGEGHLIYFTRNISGGPMIDRKVMLSMRPVHLQHSERNINGKIMILLFFLAIIFI